jgi:hypothetical protein
MTSTQTGRACCCNDRRPRRAYYNKQACQPVGSDNIREHRLAGTVLGLFCRECRGRTKRVIAESMTDAAARSVTTSQSRGTLASGGVGAPSLQRAVAISRPIVGPSLKMEKAKRSGRSGTGEKRCRVLPIVFPIRISGKIQAAYYTPY